MLKSIDEAEGIVYVRHVGIAEVITVIVFFQSVMSLLLSPPVVLCQHAYFFREMFCYFLFCNLIPYIRKFFAYLRICKVTERDNRDCPFLE